MKRYCFSIVLICSYIAATAQIDSTELLYSEEVVDEIVEYMDPIQYAFMMHEETNVLWKFATPFGQKNNSTFVQNGQINKIMGAAFEQKVGKTISLNTSISYYGRVNTRELFGMEFGPRWYFTQKKKIDLGESRSNLSGNYVGLSIGYQTEEFRDGSWMISLQAGAQRRFLSNSYFDIGFRAGLINNAITGRSWTVGTVVELGAAFAQDRLSLQRDKLCDVLKCYSSENSLLKIGLDELLQINNWQGRAFYRTAMDVAYEHKLSQTWSAQVELAGSASISEIFDGSAIVSTRVRGKVDLRNYFNLKKRIAKGLSGNGLSADYFGLVGYTTWDWARFHNGSQPDGRSRGTTVGFVFGAQRVIADRVFLDLQTGYGLGRTTNGASSSPYRLALIYELGLGYRL